MNGDNNNPGPALNAAPAGGAPGNAGAALNGGQVGDVSLSSILGQMKSLTPVTYGLLMGTVGLAIGVVLILRFSQDLPLAYIVGGVVLLFPVMFVIYGIEHPAQTLELRVMVWASMGFLIVSIGLILSSIFLYWPRVIDFEAQDSPDNLARIARITFYNGTTTAVLQRVDDNHWSESHSGQTVLDYDQVDRTPQFLMFRRSNADYREGDPNHSFKYTFVRIPPQGGRVEWGLGNTGAGDDVCQHQYCWGDIGDTKKIEKADKPNGKL